MNPIGIIDLIAFLTTLVALIILLSGSNPTSPAIGNHITLNLLAV